MAIPTLLRTALPEFANELEQLLLAEGKTELASHISRLELISRCNCGDSFCSTFYTRDGGGEVCNPIPDTMVLAPANGMINVDVTSGRITCIEVSYRPDVEEKLQVLMQR